MIPSPDLGPMTAFFKWISCLAPGTKHLGVVVKSRGLVGWPPARHTQHRQWHKGLARQGVGAKLLCQPAVPRRKIVSQRLGHRRHKNVRGDGLVRRGELFEQRMPEQHQPGLRPQGPQFDEEAQRMLPALLAAMPKGDDALLRAVLSEHERAGFRVVGVEEAMSDLLAGAGVWGAHAPDARSMRDIAKAAKVASATGAFDIGQGVVVCDGLVLAVEAQEGTDAMLMRVAALPQAIRGAPGARRGVLVKRPKPIQERRIDLPTIGVRTIAGAAAAGLAGVAVEAGGALAVRRADLIAAADQAGLFVYGFTSGETDAV